MIFASTPPINADPLPYENARPRVKNRYPDEKTAIYFSGDCYRLSPRPYFDRQRAHEANPILLAVRKEMAGTPEYAHDPIDVIEYSLKGIASYPDLWGTSEIHHARRVLSRWLAIFS